MSRAPENIHLHYPTPCDPDPECDALHALLTAVEESSKPAVVPLVHLFSILSCTYPKHNTFSRDMYLM